MIWWTLRQLKSADPVRRANVARKVGQSGNHSRPVLEALIRLLEDDDYPVQVAAAEALGSLKDAEAVEPLTRALNAFARKGGKHNAEAQGLHQAVIGALARLGEAGVDPLAAALRSSDPEVRKAAAARLGTMSSPQAVMPLLGALDDSRSEVRKAVAHALGALKASAATGGLIKALQHRDPETRRVVTEALGKIGGDQAVAALARAVNDPDEAVQLAAIEGLRGSGGLAAARGLRPAAESPKKVIRNAAAEAIHRMKVNAETASDRALLAVLRADFDAAFQEGEAAIPLLIEVLGSNVPGNRLQAAARLGRLKAVPSVPALIRLFRDADEEVRQQAVGALVEIGREAVSALIETLPTPSWTAQRLAIDSLGRIGDVRSVVPLLEIVERNDEMAPEDPVAWEVSQAACQALQEVLVAADKESLDVTLLEALRRLPEAARPGQAAGESQLTSPGSCDGRTELRAIAAAELVRRGIVL